MKCPSLARSLSVFLPLTVGALMLAAASRPSRAADSRNLISVQARITKDDTPFSGSLDLRLELHSAPSAGTPLWTEDQAGVTVSNGLLCVELGAGTPTTGVPSTLFANNADVYLAIKARDPSTGTYGEIVAPRIRMTAVPFALHAANASGSSSGIATINEDSANEEGNYGLAAEYGVTILNEGHYSSIAINTTQVVTEVVAGSGLRLTGDGRERVELEVDPASVVLGVEAGAGIEVVPGASAGTYRVQVKDDELVRSLNDLRGAVTISGQDGLRVDPSGNALLVRPEPGAFVTSLNAGAGITLSGSSGAVSVGVDPSAVVTDVQAGPSGNLSVSRGSDGVVTLDVTNGGGGLDQATADARYVNVSGDTVNSLSVNTSLSTQQLSVNGTLGFQNPPAFGGIIDCNSGGVETYLTIRAYRVNLQGISGPTDLIVSGNLSVAGAKNFVVPYPGKPNLEISYCSLEGPECAMFVRGSAQLKQGRALITLPDHFKALAVKGTVTAQVTPTADCKGLFVQRKTRGRVVVKELGGGKSDASFDYVVYARRLGHENPQPVREKK